MLLSRRQKPEIGAGDVLFTAAQFALNHALANCSTRLCSAWSADHLSRAKRSSFPRAARHEAHVRRARLFARECRRAPAENPSIESKPARRNDVERLRGVVAGHVSGACASPLRDRWRDCSWLSWRCDSWLWGWQQARSHRAVCRARRDALDAISASRCGVLAMPGAFGSEARNAPVGSPTTLTMPTYPGAPLPTSSRAMEPSGCPRARAMRPIPGHGPCVGDRSCGKRWSLRVLRRDRTRDARDSLRNFPQ